MDSIGLSRRGFRRIHLGRGVRVHLTENLRDVFDKNWVLAVFQLQQGLLNLFLGRVRILKMF